MNENNFRLTSTEEVLLAANRLSGDEKKEFKEWDLTVETWKLNKNRWGLKGYEEKYPDHKRVMNEIMARGLQKIIGRGWLERTKPNYYRITPLGLAKAKSIIEPNLTSQKKNIDLYDSIYPYISNSTFENYLKDPQEPKNWLDAAAFLKLNKYDFYTLEKRLNEIKNSIDDSIFWLNKNKEVILSRGESKSPITKDKLLKLKHFLSVLEKRFIKQFEAIRSKKK